MSLLACWACECGSEDWFAAWASSDETSWCAAAAAAEGRRKAGKKTDGPCAEDNSVVASSACSRFVAAEELAAGPACKAC